MLADIAGCALAVCLFPLFVVLPGYAIARLTGLFDFRRRTLAFQLALSVPLSIALCPALTYFAGRFGSMAAVWTLYAALGIYAVATAARSRISLAPYTRIAAVLFFAWSAIAILSLIDLQIGNRAWYPSAAFDYSIRTQFIHSIGATGIPPSNPFFYPGHPVALRYHYFWLQICALVDLAGGPPVTARHAWIGGALWCGVGLMAIVALYLRLFSYRGPETFRRRAVAGILLLGVTGLDILPTAILWALQAAGMHAVRPAMEWWNEQVDGFVYTALWESHYLSGLIACLMAFLILWDTANRTSTRVRITHALVAGIALATAFGSAIYVAFVFGFFLIVWTALTLARRARRESMLLIAAGLCGLALAIPFALSLRGPALGGPALEIWVRPFSPLDGLFRGEGIHNVWILSVANALALPLNYLLELGFFFFAALLWWQKHRAAARPLTPAESATWLMIATSVTICTFVRSSVIGNNDLGWRGFLIAQFALLLLAVDILPDLRDKRALLMTVLVLGACGSAYEIAINRFYAPMADRGIVPLFDWLAPDRQAGERNFANREAGEWAAAATPPTAIVQFNPDTGAQNTSAMLYSDRPTLAANESCLSTFGGDPALCPALVAQLNRLYQAPAQGFAEVCRALPIDLLAASDTDPAWKDRSSWVWTRTPVFANSYVRLFRCR
jgi:low affinity Fe/Cu permease